MLATGTLIDDRYELQSTLGVGGFGAVYKARQLQFDRTVALKMLSTNVLQQDDGPARFEREAQAINALKHKNIVSFYGYGVWNQAPYMVVEFVDGLSVQAEIERSGKMEPRRALMLIRQVFEALASAHASGVIHRDLKPSNIMLSRSPQSKLESVKIIDFGLAKLMPGYGIPGQKLTETGYALGSCHFMPPEQALGITVDPRADIYSAGCVLYFMLTGRLPFDADNNIAVMMQHLNVTAEPVSDSLNDHPLARSLSAFVDNCMTKDREDRYADCDRALAHIDAMLRGDAGSVQSSVNRVAQGKRFALKTSVLAWASMLALISLIVSFYLTRTPDPTAADLLRSKVGAARIGRDQVAPREVWERLCSLNELDHSLSPMEELAVTINMMRARSLEETELEDKKLARRIVDLLSAVSVSEYDLVDAALALKQLGDREGSIWALKMAMNSRNTNSSATYGQEFAIECLMKTYATQGEWSRVFSLAQETSKRTNMIRYWISVANLLSGRLGAAADELAQLAPVGRVYVSETEEVEIILQEARVSLARAEPRIALRELAKLKKSDYWACTPTLDLYLLLLSAQLDLNDQDSARKTLNKLREANLTNENLRPLLLYDLNLAGGHLERSNDKVMRDSAQYVRTVARKISKLK